MDDPSSLSSQPRFSGGLNAVQELIAAARVSEDLCETDRLLLVEHYVEERSVADIATTLRVLPGIVRQRLTRALRSMRRALSSELSRLGRAAHQS